MNSGKKIIVQEIGKCTGQVRVYSEFLSWWKVDFVPTLTLCFIYCVVLLALQNFKLTSSALGPSQQGISEFLEIRRTHAGKHMLGNIFSLLTTSVCKSFFYRAIHK